jgi:hypothetical protein
MASILQGKRNINSDLLSFTNLNANTGWSRLTIAATVISYPRGEGFATGKAARPYNPSVGTDPVLWVALIDQRDRGVSETEFDPATVFCG